MAGFADLRPSGLVRHRYDDTRATDYLTGWLTHLFLCALHPEEVALETRWISRDGDYRLHPCEDAEGVLQELLILYRRGLREPIHFFPKSAWKYIIGGASLSKATATNSTLPRSLADWVVATSRRSAEPNRPAPRARVSESQ